MGNLFTPKTTTTNQTVKPPSGVLSQYQDLLSRASGVSQDPLVSPLNQTQNAAIGSFNQIPNQYLPQALNYAQQGASSISPDQIANYSNPYQQQVVNATMGNINETNAEQQTQLKGNALAQGALGGDRLGVAQGELARQQGLANNQTLAGLNASNYQQAVAAAQADRAAAAQGAGNLAGLQTSALQAATGQLGAGTVQQNQANAQLQQPYQQATWLSSLLGGLGPLEGQTTSNATPGPSLGQSLLGGLTSLGGLFGLAKGGSVPNYDLGGDVGGIGIPIPLYQPIQVSHPLMSPQSGNGGQSNGQSGWPSASDMRGIGSGIANWFSGSPDPTGGMGLGIGQLHARGGVVRRAPGGMIPPPQQGSNVGQMITNAVNMARVLKGGIGGGQPQGFDGGGIVVPSWNSGPDFGGDFDPSMGNTPSLQGLPILPNVKPSGINLGTPLPRAASPTGAPMMLTPASASAIPLPPNGAPPAAAAPDQSGMGMGTPQAGGIGSDPYAQKALFAGNSGRTMNMPLMAAGLGMMASSSPFLGQAIGQGGLEALNYIQQQRQFERQMAMAQSVANYRNERIDMESQRLDQQAKIEAERLGLETARFDRPQFEANVGKDDFGNPIPGWVSASTGKITPVGGAGAPSGPVGATVTNASATGPGMMPDVSLDDKGAPNPNDQQDYYNWLSQAKGTSLADQVKAVANGDQDITKITSNRGGQRQQFAQLVTAYDPTWNTSLAPRRADLLKDLQSTKPGSLGGVVASANTFVQHASNALDAIDKLGLSDTPYIGSTINAVKYATQHQTGPNAPIYSKYDTAATGMADEFAKIMQGTGALTETQAKLWQDKFRAAGGNGPTALKSAIGEAMTMMSQSLAQKHQAVTDAFGGSRPDLQSFLKPDTIAKLRSIGVDPEAYDPKFSDYANAGNLATPLPKPTASAAPAAAAPTYTEGQTATGPNGAKMIFKGGAWQPLQ